MPRSDRRADILGAAAGIASVLLLFISVASVDPLRGAADQEMRTWWADGANRNGFVVSMYTLLLASPLFLLFIARVRMRLRGGDANGWADAVFACGIVVTTAIGLCALLRGIIASSIRFADEPLPGVDTLRFATSLAYGAWDLVILFVAVLVAIVSILAHATHALPRWISWLGALVTVGGVVCLAIQRAPLSLPLVNIWVLAISVQLLRAPAVAPAAEHAWRPELSSAQG